MSQPPPKDAPFELKKIHSGWFERLSSATYQLWYSFSNGLMTLPTYTVSGAPDAANNIRRLIYVSDETGGATIAFSDGTNWRRVQDRSVIS